LGDKEKAVEPQKNIWTKVVSLSLFMFVLLLIVGFDQVREWGGRYFFERKMPQYITQENVVNVFGKPDKSCVGNPKCDEYITPFVFRNKIPDYHSIFFYTKRYPILPIMIFFKDDKENIIGYDFGVRAY